MWQVLWLQLGVLIPVGGAAQTATPLDLSPLCPSCEGWLEEAATIRSEDPGVGPLEFAWTLSMDARGRYWVSFAGEFLPQVFDSNGALLSTVGRRGDGPGEFRSPLALVPVGDSMAVFDGRLQRMTMVGPDFNPVRTVRVEGEVLRGAALDWPRAVVNARVGTPAGAGYPFHIVNLETGAIEKSFGGRPGGDFSPLDRMRMSGTVVVDPSRAEFWTALQGAFRLQRWSAQGELIESLEAAPEWFAGEFTPTIGSPSVPPTPRISTMTLGPEGLWVIFRLPAETWRQAWPSGALRHGPHVSSSESPHPDLLYRSRLALIDFERRRVVGSWDVTPSVFGTGAIPGGVQSFHRETSESSYPSRTVHRVRLRPRGP